MAGNDSNNNLAIVAIVAVGVIVVVGAALFFSGVIGGKKGEPEATVVIEKQPQAPGPAEEPTGFTFKYEDGDGKKTELKTP
jgi:hypothetical protein